MTAAPRALELELELDELEDLTLVTLSGALDIYTVPGFLRDVEPRARVGGQIVIDLGEVTLIDSAGLGALMRLRNRARRDSWARLGLICPRRRLRRVFEITGLRREFLIARDLEAVRTAFSGGMRVTAQR